MNPASLEGWIMARVYSGCKRGAGRSFGDSGEFAKRSWNLSERALRGEEEG